MLCLLETLQVVELPEREMQVRGGWSSSDPIPENPAQLR